VDDIKGVGFEDGKWMKVAQNCVQWRDLVLSMLNLL
jgi:hypothetical protein